MRRAFPLPFDYVLVGGGLQNALIAAALARYRPNARVALIDSQERLGLGHTWCLHARDIDSRAARFVTPFLSHIWRGYEVTFPKFTRSLDATYACVTGEHFHRTVVALFASAPEWRLLLGRKAKRIEPNLVELDDGEQLEAEVVIDARGPGELRAKVAGYQKFFGLEIEFEEPHGISRPLLIDACLPQTDGFRFMYVLPFEQRRALFEDTYFSSEPSLDRARLGPTILDYASRRGGRIVRVIREESSVLPLPLQTPPPRLESPLRAGYSGGWLHPTTGYSFPVAARLADFIAQQEPESLFGPAFTAFAREHWSQLRFMQLLNRLLFGAFDPEGRISVFERFYQLPEPTIHRFYALTTTAYDRARIVCGRPPRGISMLRALTRFSEVARARLESNPVGEGDIA